MNQHEVFDICVTAGVSVLVISIAVVICFVAYQYYNHAWSEDDS